MPFKKNNKIGNGRPKGIPNKTSRPIKECLSAIVQDAFDSDKLQRELAKLKGKDYIDALAKIVPYVCAKPTQSVDVETSAPLQIVLTSQIPKNE